MSNSSRKLEKCETCPSALCCIEIVIRKVQLFKYQPHSSLLTDKLGQILNLKYSRSVWHCAVF